jgi:DNA-binding HxlR family transcriptional regulator
VALPMNDQADRIQAGLIRDGCQVREILNRVADKWSLYVVAVLGDEELRFTELKRRIDGISQRMLTVTLRTLERDGILIRTVYNPMPPHIAYRLTSMGTTLLASTTPLIGWANEHLQSISAAQDRYDNRCAASAAPENPAARQDPA